MRKVERRPDVSGMKVLVVGLGISGIWTTRWLVREGARVSVSEIRPQSELDRETCKEMTSLGVAMETGGHKEETFLNADMIVVSPGVPHQIAPFRAATMKGIPVMGELELASRLIDTPTIAVTGTNGKSTTVAFLGFMLQHAGLRTFVGGNVGTPLMAHVASGETVDYVVVEVSSFQLDTSESFSPFVSVILNVSPDHLDRYPDFEAYVESKLRVFKNQGSGQFLILNKGDERLSRVHPGSGVSVLSYGYDKAEGLDAFVENRGIKVRLDGSSNPSFSLERFHLPGRHNVENLLASVLTGLTLGIETSTIQMSIHEFKGLPHRLELVAKHEGVSFYNDSKATNVDAAVKSISSFTQPIVLIAGGRHKGADYGSLVTTAREHVRSAIFLGEARELLGKSFQGTLPFTMAATLEEAVSMAFSEAKRGEVVLLAPACSSFDMFSDYKHRGDVFRSAVERIVGG